MPTNVVRSHVLALGVVLALDSSPLVTGTSNDRDVFVEKLARADAIRRDPFELAPGDTKTFTFDLADTLGGCTLLGQPGEFTIWIEYRSTSGSASVDVRSNELAIVVGPGS